MLEARSSPRLSTSLPVALYFPGEDPGEGWGRLIDISLGGVKLETRWALKVGQAIYLTFCPRPGLRLENVRGRVTRVGWEEGYYLGGVHFDASVDANYLKEALLALMTT